MLTGETLRESVCQVYRMYKCSTAHTSGPILVKVGMWGYFDDISEIFSLWKIMFHE